MNTLPKDNTSKESTAFAKSRALVGNETFCASYMGMTKVTIRITCSNRQIHKGWHDALPKARWTITSPIGRGVMVDMLHVEEAN